MLQTQSCFSSSIKATIWRKNRSLPKHFLFSFFPVLALSTQYRPFQQTVVITCGNCIPPIDKESLTRNSSKKKKIFFFDENMLDAKLQSMSRNEAVVYYSA